MRQCLILAGLLAFSAGTAHAETRVAFSQKLGVEVLADDPDWCSRTPMLRIVGQNADVFRKSDLATLVQHLGVLVLARQCPAAQDVRFAGSVKGDPKPIWHGTAAVADQWMLRPATGETATVSDLDSALNVAAAKPGAPDSSPPAPVPAGIQASPAPPSVSAPTSPLLGEWTDTTGCNADSMAATTISVFGVQGAAAHAYVQVAPSKFRAQAGLLRFRADGSFDAGSGQFALHPGKVIRANGDNPPQLTGTIDPGAGIMALQGVCWGNAPAQTLSQTGTTPVLARRIMHDLERRAEWTAEAAAQPRTAGRLVGTLPKGDARQPSCEELLAWAAAAPLDLRVRLLASDSNGILRQYDDANSARVFGTAAYYWFTTDSDGRQQQSIQPANVAMRACTSQADRRDPRFNALMQVANDWISRNVLAERRHTDELVDQLPVRVATTGGSASEMYHDLAPLTQADTLSTAFQDLTAWNAQALNDANRAQLVSEAVRLRGVLAGRAAADAKQAIADAPQTEAGLAEVNKAVARFTDDFPDDAGPIREAGAAKRREIAQALAASSVSQLQVTPKTLDGLSAARAQVAHLKAEAGRDLPNGGAAADAALAKFQGAAIPAILSTEANAVATAPATVEGAQALSAHRDRILGIVGPGGGDEAKSYRAAVDARLAAIGKATEPDLQKRLAALDESWASVAAARHIAHDAALPFGASPAAQELITLGDARADAILAALGTETLSSINTAKGDSIRQIAGVLGLGTAAVQPFAQDPDGKAQVARIAQAAQQRTSDLAAAYFPTYRANLDKAEMSRRMAWKLAQAWVVLQRVVVPRIPAFQRYADATRDAALRVEDGACSHAAADLGISAADAKLPMVLGNRVSTLGAFACDLADAGVRHGKFTALAGADPATADHMLKLYVPSGEGERVMQDAFSQAGFGAGMDGAPDPATTFDFAETGAKPPSAASDDDIQDILVIVLRQEDIGVDREALVGVQVGDESKMQTLSVAEWRLASGGGMGAGGMQAEIGPGTCAVFAANPAKLPPSVEARALLTCPRKS